MTLAITAGVPSSRPEVVALVSNESACAGETPFPGCTAVRFDRAYALTAAHCVASLPTEGLAVAMEPTPGDPSEWVSVVGIAVHPAYVPGTNDLAVLALHPDAAAGLPDVSVEITAPVEGALLTLVGYGETEDDRGNTRQHEGLARLAEVHATDLVLAPAPANGCRRDSGGGVFDEDGALVAIIRGGDGTCMDRTSATRLDVYWEEFVVPSVADFAIDPGHGARPDAGVPCGPSTLALRGGGCTAGGGRSAPAAVLVPALLVLALLVLAFRGGARARRRG